MRELGRIEKLALRAALAECRADLSAMNFRHECRAADLRRELDALRDEYDCLLRELEETRTAFEGLKSVVRRRIAAEQELTSLRREAELARQGTPTLH